MDALIKGIDLDQAGRCIHYHQDVDVVALKCAQCGNYYACYKCHDSLTDHSFKATNSSETYPIICGACHNHLTYNDYQLDYCPKCQHAFNPNCRRHSDIYFDH